MGRCCYVRARNGTAHVNSAVPVAAPASDRAQTTARRGLIAVSAATVVLGVLATIIWVGAGGGFYWPGWVWLGCLTGLAPLTIYVHLQSQPSQHRSLLADADAGAALAGYCVLIWLFAGARAPFWPVWVIVSVLAVLGVHALIAYLDRFALLGHSRALSERVDTLTRTRRGALEVQAAQLQRIERDLHDGAQARLVALSMHLGRAEARLGHDVETQALVRAARDEAGAAIAELRDLARGIAPPVLADRGLTAAVRSLAERCTVPVTVTDHSRLDRLPPAVENAAYFVIAEALTNVAKHAPRATATVTLSAMAQTLLIDVADTGPGGAVQHSNGLDGLRARVEALDGTFSVMSPIGGPTVIHAELPCES